MAEAHRSKLWRNLSDERRAVGRARSEPCCICGRDVDYSLPPNSRMGATVEHLVPVALGGPLLPSHDGLKIAHRSCNSRGGPAVRRRSERGVRMSSDIDADLSGSLMGPSDWVGVPVGANAPRLFSAPHPEAVGSHGAEAVEWIDARRGSVGLPPLYWFQRVVLERGLEVDEAGEYCWHDVVVTIPRQCGKTTLLGELALWRAHQESRFGEVQQVIHVANNLLLAHRTMQPFWSWAEDQGYRKHRATNGAERLFVGDREEGSQWGVFSHKSAFGASSGFRVIDEAAMMSEQTKDEVLDPTGSAVEGSQSWAFGMALADCTSLVPSLRADAGDAANGVCLMEWSAAPDADVSDVRVFLEVVPELTGVRERAYRRAHQVRRGSFREQYLNQWPAMASQAGGFPGGWGECGLVQGVPPLGGVAAVSGARDRSSFVAVVAVAVGGGVGVWCWRAGSLSELGAVLSGWGPSVVRMGPGLVKEQGFDVPVELVSASGSSASLSELEREVRRGRLSHEHVSWVDDQVAAVRLSDSELGRKLDERSSVGPVEVVRAIAWAVWGLSLPAVAEEAAIW